MTAPLRTRAVNVVTLADVTWIVAPDPGEAGTARLWRVVVPPVARRADRVLALSQAGAEHVVEYLHVPRERIDVVPLASGGSDLLAPTPAERAARASRSRRGPRRPDGVGQEGQQKPRAARPRDGAGAGALA